ncbi:MAG: hypothetical protein RLZZ511_1928 [Cyanobacteriota bacterium]|jgi:hypothetical protein
MTTFTKAELPSDINTVEQVALWCALVLNAVNGQKAVIEAVNTIPEPIAQYNIFQSPNDGLRTLTRLDLPLDPASASDRSKKLWRFANEMTIGAIPAPFTTN